MLPALVAARAILRQATKNNGLPPSRHHLHRPAAAGFARPSRQQYGRLSTNRTTRRISTSNHQHQESETELRFRSKATDQKRPEDSEWTPLYRFKHIRLAGTISRLKIVQTVFVSAMGPIFGIMYQANDVTFETMITIGGLGAFALVVLYAISGALRRCIGVISISRDGRTVRVGYLTFWGWRRNVVIPVDDIVPLEEGNASLSPTKSLPPYVQLKTYSNSKFRLYLPLSRVEIVDQPLFESVFGELPHAKKKST